jgi:hypothetical protein
MGFFFAQLTSGLISAPRMPQVGGYLFEGAGSIRMRSRLVGTE